MNKVLLMKTNRQLLFVPILFAVCGWIVLMTSGCMVGPDYHSPHPEVPSGWAGVTQAPAAQPSVPTSQPAELTQWWKQFDDPMLAQLVEDALRANLDVQLAVARLRQARAARGIAAAGLWPSVGASADYQRGQPVTTHGAAGQGQDLYQLGFDAVWEIDLFGGQRRNVESANANVHASIESISDAQVSLAAEVALNYVQLRGYQQEIVIAQKNLKAMQNTALITRQRSNAGFSSALDVANADASVSTTEAQIPVFEIAAQQSIYALSVLLARPPAYLLDQLAPTGSIPGVPAQVPAGLPSDLLRRRPDIRQAEAQLHAATARIGVATADLFPKFSLTGAVNWQDNLLNTWWTAASKTYSFGPSVTWQVFQGGAIVSNIREQEALRDQAFITYRKIVLSAFQDVENALIAFIREQDHNKLIKESVAANSIAVDLSLKLYTEGLLDFLNVLVAQRSLYAAEDALVQSNRNVAADLIALCKALGGGWESLPADGPAMASTAGDAATAITR
ncbi:MAG: efflux transporter outer membrane subunit [Syntrophobacteraceae bacterium]|jgi:NodT family efflux transporter outer membrane factor (OMF) lipoprotein